MYPCHQSALLSSATTLGALPFGAFAKGWGIAKRPLSSTHHKPCHLDRTLSEGEGAVERPLYLSFARTPAYHQLAHFMLNTPNIPVLHDQATAHWHDAASPLHAATTALDKLILDHHRANFDLWHTEDQARAPHVTGEAMIAIKHNIDRLNQQRNDLVERIDIALLEAVPNQPLTAPLHSETPGLMIDRLSILALKIFHTEEETRRPDAAPEHHQRNRDRLELLTAQRNDLAAALTALWAEVLAGTRRFKLYRQLKMYNDPTLNPVLYAQPTKTS